MKHERKNVTQPGDWWAAFEEQAWREGKTLSAWIGDACKDKLPARRASRLSQRERVGAKKGAKHEPRRSG